MNLTSSSNDVAITSRCRAKWPWVYNDGVITSEWTSTIWTISAPLFQQCVGWCPVICWCDWKYWVILKSSTDSVIFKNGISRKIYTHTGVLGTVTVVEPRRRSKNGDVVRCPMGWWWSVFVDQETSLNVWLALKSQYVGGGRRGSLDSPRSSLVSDLSDPLWTSSARMTMTFWLYLDY